MDRRWIRLLGIAALGVGLTVSGSMAQAVPSTSPTTARTTTQVPPVSDPAQSTRPTGERERAVTLITGDTVFIRPRSKPMTLRIEPAKGREHIRFRSKVAGDRAVVVPSDAESLLAKGKLDERLFEVTAPRTSDPHFVLSYGKNKSKNSIAGATPTRNLPALNAKAFRASKADALKAWQAIRADRSFEKVWLDGLRKPLLDQSVPQIGAPEAWKAGYTGKGVTVAVLDTGIEATHADLAGQVSGAKDFSGTGPGDKVGHGTHVASTIASTGKAAPGKYKGVAPDAKVLDGKVCGDEWCEDSAILAGMQWAAVEKKASVVNLSLGGENGQSIDLLERAVNTLTKQTGTLFVIAAGNGWEGCAVSSPGSADAALTVGAVDKEDELADFSCVGPRAEDGGLKPDITAPGVDIVAAKAKDAVIGEPVGANHLRLSGTSMATPHVVGAAALLAQQHPTWKATELKGALVSSAKPHPKLTAFQQGGGRVDVPKAIQQNVIPSSASLWFGKQLWPHNDDKPVVRSLRYRNLGTAAVKLELSATLQYVDGSSAPAGLVKLDKTSVSIAAGSSALVKATVDTTVGGKDGALTGTITATGGPVDVRTPIGVEKEVESYDITVKHLDRSGKPTSSYGDDLIGLDVVAGAVGGEKAGGVATYRLPKGHYVLTNDILDRPGTKDEKWVRTVAPYLFADKAKAIVVDARKAKAINATVASNSKVTPFALDHSFDAANGWSYGYTIVGEVNGIYTARLGDKAPVGKLVSWLSIDGGTADRYYALRPFVRAGFFNGYSKSFEDAELVKVRHDNVAPRAGLTVARDFAGFPPGAGSVWAMVSQFNADRPVFAYHLPSKDTRWALSASFGVSKGNDFVWEEGFSSGWRTYVMGKKYSERWGAAVLAPSLRPWIGEPVATLARNGDLIQTAMGGAGDAAGHLGGAALSSGRNRLFYNGKKIWENTEDPGYGRAPVPAAEGTYRMEFSTIRKTTSAVSTRVDTAWTFKSKYIPWGGDTIEGWKPIPVWALRFMPTVNALNQVKRSPVQLMPFRLEALPGSPVGTAGTPQLEVSFDTGRTWKKAPVAHDDGPKWLAIVFTPSDATSVSLRVKATDTKGNVVEQTVIDAYRLIP